MLSAHEIFRDAKENSVSLNRNSKFSSGVKTKGLGLKNSTNTEYRKKSNSISPEECKKVPFKPVKTINQDIENFKSLITNSTKVKSKVERHDEIENMYIYKEPEDDYEDILPKSERFTKKEIDYFFRRSHIESLVELNYDDLPEATLEEIDIDTSEDLYFPIAFEEELYVDIPLEIIPEPSLLFDV